MSSTEPSAEGWRQPRVRHFDHITGHERAIARLRERLNADKNETSIILHGPSGLGKRSLARVYAASLLCEGSPSGPKPCGSCPACDEVHGEGGWNFLTFDPIEGEADKEKRSKNLREKVRYPPMNGRRRVIQIDNADKFTDGAFDPLLKVLEEAKYPRTFVLVATRLQNVRLAGQSRSIGIRLRRLAPDELRRFTLQLCQVNKIACTNAVLDALLAESDGRPGRAAALLKGMRQRKDMSLIGLKAAAGREWLELAADQWRAALMKSACSADAVLAETPGLFSERSVRAQWIVKELWALHVANQVAKGSAPVALLNQPLLDIFEAVTASARRVALGPDELIQQLSSELLAGV